MSSRAAIPFLSVGALSHQGKVRGDNQDRLGHLSTVYGEIFVVADGMGGHRGGAQAAEMTLEGLERHLASRPAETPVAEALQDAALETNAEIYERANSGDPEVVKMGATMVLALLEGTRLAIAHAGDSRAYLFREGELRRLTRDHTPIQNLIDHEILTEEEARGHPHASIVSRGFGQEEALELEFAEIGELGPGDRILLCSDGLSGQVRDPEIAAVLENESAAQKAAEALVELALEAGGEDNVTVQVIQLATPEEAAEAKARAAAEARGTAWRWALVVLVVALAALAALYFGGLL